MSQYRFELAGLDDDADLRHILAATPMEGSMVISFRREPSYFAAATVDGRFRQVVAARHVESGRVVGFGSRSITERFVNGTPTCVGYLSSLRLLEDHRNFGLVARGYRYFRGLHADGRAEIYLTTIAEKNRPALELLTSGRAGLPPYQPAGTFHTVAIPVAHQKKRSPIVAGLTMRAAEPADCEMILSLLQSEGSRRQFFPCYSREDLLGDGGLLRGLSLRNLTLAFRGQQFVGIAGWWDQRSFRQTVIERYRGPLGWLRAPYNALAPLAGRPRLSAPGVPLRDVYLALPLALDDDKEVFAALLGEIMRRVADEPVDYLLAGMHESDPLLGVLRTLRGIWYNTLLFFVTWSDGRELAASLTGRPLYLELGAL